MARHPMVRGALAGFGLGLLWGVAARVMMRLLTDTPEFSWAGTGFILGLSAVLGTGLGLLAAAKSAGRRRWWLLAVVPGLLLFAGPGAPFLPAFLVGGLVFTHRHWALRVLGAVAIAGGVVFLWSQLRIDQETMLSAPTDLLVRGLVAFALVSVGVAAGGSVLYRPWGARARSTRRSSPAAAATRPVEV
jgi:hypothetical protein